ncbi:MAG: UDP-N-acetylmuramoyl-L-alanine--D-glutamate ligase [Simkaniaceae bacterium]|nr:UDP-N-acetylmuramoyl-L-alanine--D-glutamate ligase [Simkaniaceae bacterium]
MKYQIIGEGLSAKGASQLIEKMGDSIVSEGGDIVVISPGYPLTHPVAVEGRRLGAEIIGEMELGMRYVQNRCLAITGTNGKTTATMLTAHVLNATGTKAKAVGNIGIPLCSYLLDPDPEEVLVVEVSSFQIETMKTPVFAAGGITNITPDHLDRYTSYEEYVATKHRLRHFVKGPFYEGDDLAFRLSGLNHAEFLEAQKTFVRPPHRMELIKTVDGISFYNDSKGTNVDAVCYAVKGMTQPIILIAGGRDKGASYEIWNPLFENKVKRVFAIGEAAEKIRRELKVEVELVGTLERAFEKSLEYAKEGDAILLSPGCSSFDQFENYIERGNTFKRLVEEKT